MAGYTELIKNVLTLLYQSLSLECIYYLNHLSVCLHAYLKCLQAGLSFSDKDK